MAHTSTSFKRHIRYTLAVLMALVGVFAVYVQFEKTIDAANVQRLKSLKLADEMRRSSDDLTRMVRLYVVTGDERYQSYYDAILDIREGRKPRPENDGVISLDMRADAGLSAGSGKAIALLDPILFRYSLKVEACVADEGARHDGARCSCSSCA